MLLWFSVDTLNAQNSINILQADSIVGGQVEGQRVQKILGHVHLRSNDMAMKCDSAYQFVNKNEFRAYGNIEIDTGEEHIWTDTLVYFSDVDFSQLRGRVVIEADTTTLFGHSVDYRFSTKVAHFIDHIRLEDQQGVLVANSGFYYREADSAVFRGQVQVADTVQYLEGDSLFSNRQTDYYEIHGNVFAHDRKNKTMLKGDYLQADSTGRRLLEGNAWLKSFKNKSNGDSTQAASPQTQATRPDSLRPDSLFQRPVFQPDSLAKNQRGTSANQPVEAKTDTSRADTTHIRAKKILSVRRRTETDTATTIHAFHNVRIWSMKFSAISDSARYESDTEIFELRSNPKAWHETIQLTGPYILVRLEDGSIKQLTSHPNPFTVQQDTVLDRLNQIKGDTLNAYFNEGNLSRIVVNGNSHLLYFTEDDSGQPDGGVELTAPVTRLLFENGRPDSLISIGNLQGSYLPESEQTAQRRLDGFTWNPEMRPQRPTSKMEPRFPPIPDKRPFKLPRRYREHIGEIKKIPVPIDR